jgi:hypothetical protein
VILDDLELDLAAGFQGLELDDPGVLEARQCLREEVIEGIWELLFHLT